MTSKTVLTSVNVVDVEKRRKPSKHYSQTSEWLTVETSCCDSSTQVYVMDVGWSDGHMCRIARRFSTFFEMHMALLDKFPTEGGRKDPSQRILPFLPGKLFFKRSATRDVTMQRLGKISEYCEQLTKLPDHIARCDIIMNFFRAGQDDEEENKKKETLQAVQKDIRSISGPIELESYIAIADYKAETKKQIQLYVGEVVEVIDKSDSGWWLVCNTYDANGFVPGAFLERLDGTKEDVINGQEDLEKGIWYRAKSGYEATGDDEVGFPVGALVQVLQKKLDGWWLVRTNEKDGWAPGSYLAKSDLSPRPLSGNGLAAGDIFSDSDSDKLRVNKLPPKQGTVRRKLKPEERKAALKRMDTFEEQKRSKYITLYRLDNTIKDGISFEADEIVEVVEQSDNGWWYVEMGNKRGWVPANYLQLVPTEADIATESRDTKAAAKPWERLRNKSGNDILPEIKRDTEPNSTTSNVQALQNKLASSTQSNVLLRSKPERPVRPPLAIKNKTKPLPGLSDGVTKTTTLVSPELKNPGLSPTFPRKTRSPTFEQCQTDSEYVAMVNFSGPRKTNLENELWFHDISRQEAETMLKEEGKEGYFIVRRSKAGGTNNPYALTIFHGRTIFHFHIRKRKDGRFATGVYSDGEKHFEDVQELVKFYKQHTLVIGDDSNRTKLVGTPEAYL